MADSETSPRIQFGEDIHPVKTSTSKVYNKDASLSEKNGFDVEDRALQIANADLNQKKKQVSESRPISGVSGSAFNWLVKTYTGWMLMWLAYQSTGVIYGDIGTSP